MPATHTSETTSADFSWKDLVAAIFAKDYQPSHAFTIEFLEEIPKNALQQYLGHFLMDGAKRKFKKELSDLSPDEIDILRHYLKSIGWDADYQVKTRMQKLQDGTGKETQVNYYLIDFFPAKRDELNDPNRPDKFS